HRRLQMQVKHMDSYQAASLIPLMIACSRSMIVTQISPDFLKMVVASVSTWVKYVAVEVPSKGSKECQAVLFLGLSNLIIPPSVLISWEHEKVRLPSTWMFGTPILKRSWI